MPVETKLPGRSATGTSNESGLAGVAFFSDGPSALVAFYEQVLRVSFEHRVHEDGREHWIAPMGDAQFEIKSLVTADGSTTVDAYASDESVGMSRGEASFSVVGISAAVARAMMAGARTLQKAETLDWGTFAVLLDPDSNRIGLFEPLVASAASSTPTPDMEGQA